MLPDREIPQRIAFVSDKVFEPSPGAAGGILEFGFAPRLRLGLRAGGRA